MKKKRQNDKIKSTLCVKAAINSIESGKKRQWNYGSVYQLVEFLEKHVFLKDNLQPEKQSNLCP